MQQIGSIRADAIRPGDIVVHDGRELPVLAAYVSDWGGGFVIALPGRGGPRFEVLRPDDLIPLLADAA